MKDQVSNVLIPLHTHTPSEAEAAAVVEVLAVAVGAVIDVVNGARYIVSVRLCRSSAV